MTNQEIGVFIAFNSEACMYFKSYFNKYLKYGRYYIEQIRECYIKEGFFFLFFFIKVFKSTA